MNRMHVHRTVTFHRADDSSIAPARRALLDALEGPWCGEPRWILDRFCAGGTKKPSRTFDIAARRGSSAIEIIPMIANHGISSFEMIWRDVRRVTGRLHMACRRSAFPEDMSEMDAPSMLRFTQDLVRDALDVLDPAATIHPPKDDPEAFCPTDSILMTDGSFEHAPLVQAIIARRELCDAAMVSCDGYEWRGEIEPVTWLQMPSPWEDAKLVNFSGDVADDIPDDIRSMLEQSMVGTTDMCESISLPVKGNRLFDIRVRPVRMHVGKHRKLPDVPEAMRRISRSR